MKGILKKKLIVGVALLFITLAMSPIAIGDVAEEVDEAELITIECMTLSDDGTLQQETISLSEAETATLISAITQFIYFLQTNPDKEEIIDVLSTGGFYNDHPILSKLLSYLFSTKLLGNRKLVASLGWGYCFNPFKEIKTGIIKPIAFWHYTGSSTDIPFPSTTAIIDLNPFEIKTLTGFQFGFMLRFHGFYIHIPRPLPQQSMTFFIGTARHAGGFALPDFSLPQLS